MSYDYGWYKNDDHGKDWHGGWWKGGYSDNSREADVDQEQTGGDQTNTNVSPQVNAQFLNFGSKNSASNNVDQSNDQDQDQSVGIIF